jgi:hypothetical protein
MPEGNATLIAYYTGIESIDRQAIYNAVYHQLYDIGIYSNLDSVTNENVDSFSNLSFRTDYGTLRLDGTWDLTDSAVQVFLN